MPPLKSLGDKGQQKKTRTLFAKHPCVIALGIYAIGLIVYGTVFGGPLVVIPTAVMLVCISLIALIFDYMVRNPAMSITKMREWQVATALIASVGVTLFAVVALDSAGMLQGVVPALWGVLLVGVVGIVGMFRACRL